MSDPVEDETTIFWSANSKIGKRKRISICYAALELSYIDVQFSKTSIIYSPDYSVAAREPSNAS